MEEESGSDMSERGFCPICSTLQDNLNDHMANHSKEEILQSFSFKSFTSNGTTNQGIHASSRMTAPNVNFLQRQPSAQINTSLVNSPLYSPSFSNITPIGSNNVIAPSYLPTRNIYGSASTNHQFTATSLPVVYRPPSSFPNNLDASQSSSLLFSNSQYNLNSFKGPTPLLNSFPMNPFMNQNQPMHSTMVVPASPVCGLSPSVIGTGASSPRVVASSINTSSSVSSSTSVSGSSQSGSSTTVTSNPGAIMSPMVSVGQQQQPMICVLPYNQAMQPVVNPGGTFILCGNNLIPSGSFMPEVVPGGLNYMISNNNPVGVNNPLSMSPNQSLFSSTTGLPNFEVKPELATPFVNIPQRLNALNNLPIVTLAPNSNQSLANNVTLDNGASDMRKDHQESLVTDSEDNKAVIEIGKNIKISLPKNAIGHKEKLKELINKELVRALLINDAEELEDSSDEEKEKANKLEVSTELLSETNEQGVGTYTVSCTPSKSGFIDHNNIRINPNLPVVSNNYSDCQSSLSRPSTSRNRMEDESTTSVGYDNFAIDLSTSNSVANKSSRTSDETKNTLKPELKMEESMLVSSLSDLSFSFMSTDKNLSTIFGSNYSSASFAEDQVLGAVEEVFASESQPLSSKAGPSNINFENQLMQLFPQEETLNNNTDDGNSSLHSPRLSPSKLRTYFSPSKLSSPSKYKISHEEPRQTESVNEYQKDALETTSFSCSQEEEPFLRGDEDSLSNDSKEVQTTLYSKVNLMKPESSESNGTHTEEVMSLKASETLADSDSERATPNEEVELFFVGGSGPAHFSKGAFSSQLPQLESFVDPVQSIEVENNSADEDDPLQASSHQSETSNDQDNTENETINMTIDSNCCILPEEALSFIEESEATGSNTLEGIWTKQSWIEDVKPLVTTTESLPTVMSPPSKASTSGLQKLKKRDSSKTKEELLCDEEEYDFDYESDCYGDSDSEMAFRGHSDLDHWRCSKCQKTFKSLKEKLLHSGHHQPCVNNGSSVKESCDALLKLSSDPQSSSGLVLKDEKMSGFYDSQDELNESSGKLCKCTECGRDFPTVEKLYEHRVTMLKSRYACPICHKEFQKRIAKMHHIKTHLQEGFKCLICNRAFDGLYSWSQHQLQHVGFVAYECGECGFKCIRKGELRVHQRKHTGERPYNCSTCSASFITSYSLKRHLITHLKDQEAECEICHKKYKNAVGLSKHKLLIHNKKKKFLKKRSDFMCPVCHEIFGSEKKLTWHLEIHERWPKKCQECGDCFIHQPNLTKHIRMKHNSAFIPEGNKDNEPCPVCKKIYKKSSIALHMRTHTGDKPYSCNVCNKRFSVKCNYLAHRWVHVGVRDRPFKCKLCDRSFHRKRFLESHIRSHKKIRPYTCNECGKSFIHKNNFRTHVKQHTEEKQHVCEHCGKTFHRKYNLNNHVRIHTRETPYECSICRKEFTQKSNYNVHMKAFHVERHAVHEEV